MLSRDVQTFLSTLYLSVYSVSKFGLSKLPKIPQVPCVLEHRANVLRLVMRKASLFGMALSAVYYCVQLHES